MISGDRAMIQTCVEVVLLLILTLVAILATDKGRGARMKGRREQIR